MRISVREWAERHGIADRTVRAKLQRGTLPGGKERDPVTGVEVWYVEVADTPEGWTSDRPEQPEERSSRPPEASGPQPAVDFGELVQLLREKDQTILELSGRLGFVMGQLEEARTKIALLEAPAESSVNSIRAEDGQAAAAEMNHPAPVENAPRVAPDQGRSAPNRPWWRRWLGWATQPV